MTETALRDRICDLAKSLSDRSLTHGSTGNISALTEDGGPLVLPTGTSFGRLDPARFSRFDAAGRLIGGKPPTKEMPLTARLALLLRGTSPRILTGPQVRRVITRFDVEWDE